MKVSTKQGKYFRGGKVQKSFLFGFCIFAFVLFRVFWYRTFYIINEVEFTVWKTYKGCYITPYKYWGVLPPKDNYLRISNIGIADIFICKDKTLIIRSLVLGVEDTILNVKDYLWANPNGLLSYSQCTGDSIATYQVGIFDVQTRKTQIIGKSFNEVAQFSWDKKGEKLAFLGLLEKSTLTKKPFSLYLFHEIDSR